jgi:hypothetical protein
MKDPFSYSARWDSVGLDCTFCKHQSDAKWPNIAKDYKCNLHKISLAKEIGENGFKDGEWFCSEFSNNGKANSKAVDEFKTIKHELNPDILYGAYGIGQQLKEIPFVDL